MLAAACRTTVWLASLLLPLIAVTGHVQGAEKTAADLLPATVALYAEIAQPAILLNTLRGHPLRGRIESLDPVQTAREKKPYLDLMAGVAIVESKMGLPWHKVLAAVGGGGIAVGVDSTGRGVAVLIKASQAGVQKKLLDTLLQLATADAAAKGKPHAIKSGEYRGIPAYAADRVKVAIAGPWLVLTNQEALGKQTIDRWLDSSTGSLAADEQFQTARRNSQGSSTAWAYVNLAELRRSGAAKKVFEGKAQNPLAELILGGVLGILPHTPYATLSLSLDEHQFQLVANSPFDADWTGETREHFFGPAAKGAAPSLLLPEDSLLSVSAYRDISDMWLRAGDLFDARMNEELAKADSNLATLFGGKDFGEDILGSIQPEIQLTVGRQSFAPDQPAPAIKLPAFALSARLRDPERMQPELRRTFQSLIGFLNIVGAMNGQPQLDQEMEKTENTQFLIAHYLPDAKAKDPLNLKIHFNLSPTVAFAGNRLVISSSEPLARKLTAAESSPAERAGTERAAETPGAGAEGAAPRVTNTLVQARFQPLHDILADNRGQLIAQNMLKEGHTKEEAEKSVGVLLELISWLDTAKLQLDQSTRDLRLVFQLGIRPPGGTGR